GAVEAAVGLWAERRFRKLALAAPDVRVADEVHGCRQDALLPRRQFREDEALRQRLEARRVELAELEDPGGGERGFGVSCGLSGRELELVEGGRMIRAETEQPGDGLGAEARRGRQSRGPRGLRKEPRGVGEAEGCDEARVERGHR